MQSSQQIGSIWPTVQDYDQAMQNRTKTVSDSEIKNGELAIDAAGPMRLNGGGGKYVCVYKVGNWAVRCFTGYPPSDIDGRYGGITRFLAQHSKELPFLVNHTWIKDGVRIHNRSWPLLKVPYIADCQPLGEFLYAYHHDPIIVQMLADKWLDMIAQLEARQVAHGDLDVTNVLIGGKPPFLSLHLI